MAYVLGNLLVGLTCPLHPLGLCMAIEMQVGFSLFRPAQPMDIVGEFSQPLVQGQIGWNQAGPPVDADEFLHAGKYFGLLIRFDHWTAGQVAL